jgi:hypothetical protein
MLLDNAKLRAAGQPTLELVDYRRFLLGANQLAVYRLASIAARGDRRASPPHAPEWDDDLVEGPSA